LHATPPCPSSTPDGAGPRAAAICEIGFFTYSLPQRAAPTLIPIRFRRAAISAIGEVAASPTKSPPRGEKWPLPATDQRLSPPPCAGPPSNPRRTALISIRRHKFTPI